MKTNHFMNRLRQLKVGRFRLINFKLWGNHRWGLYREISAEALPALIREFNRLTTSIGDTSSEGPSEERKLFRTGSNYAILTRLCEQYYVYEGNEKLQQRVIIEVESILDELRNDEEAHAEFEELLNAHNKGLMHRFRTDHPALKEKDCRLYAYLAAGLSATTIAVLLDKEKSVVYNRISRLKKGIKAEYLDRLG